MKFEELRKDLAFLGGMGGAFVSYFFFEFEASSRTLSILAAAAKAGIGGGIGAAILMGAGGIFLATNAKDRLIYLVATVVLGAFAFFMISEYATPPGSKPKFDYTLF